MQRWGFIALGGAIIAVPVLLACSFGHADMVRRDQYGGVLALKGAKGAAMEDAEQQMASHCGPGNYQVTAEEQVVVGEQTHSDARTDDRRQNHGRSTHGSERSSATTTTTNVTEHHITYQCGGAPAAAAPPPPPPAAAPPPEPAGATPATPAQPNPGGGPATPATPADPAGGPPQQ